jgi:hypothetical protein
LRFNMPVRTVLCTAAGINAVVGKFYPRDAAGPAVAAPTRKAAAKKPPAKEPSQRQPWGEKQKRHAMLAVIGFNVTVILSVIVLVMLQGGRLAALGILDFAVVIVLAMIAAGATYWIASQKDL